MCRETVRTIVYIAISLITKRVQKQFITLSDKYKKGGTILKLSTIYINSDSWVLKMNIVRRLQSLSNYQKNLLIGCLN
jgi:hypothetical protein